MDKTYIVTFADGADLDGALKAIASTGAREQSVQRFIGTAVLLATAEQAEAAKAVPGVAAVEPELSMRAI